MLKRSLRRASTQPDRSDAAGSDLASAKRTSTTPDQSGRRPSLANLSKRLGRSKKSQSTTTSPPRDGSNKLGELFTALPHDIHTLIFSVLSASDILSLRLTSASMNLLLNDCASSITYSILSSTVSPQDLPHVLKLYPQPAPNYDLTHLLALLRRHHVVQGTSSMLVNFIRMKIYMLRTHRQQHNPILELTQHPLTTTITTALWFINHFLENHRTILLNIHPVQHNSKSATRSRFWPCQLCGDLITEMVASYPQCIILPTYHVYHLLTLHLRQSSRAPSYTGTIERALRGWSRKPPGTEQLAMVVLLGGLEELRSITVLKGTYNNRLETLKAFLIKVEDSVEERKVRDAVLGIGPKPRVGKMLIGPRGIEKVELDGDQTTESSFKSPAQATNTTNTILQAAEIPSRDLTDSHKPALHLLSEDVLTLIPQLEDILLLPLRRRIETEILDPAANNHLLDFLSEEDRGEELETPYHWVDRMASGDEGEIEPADLPVEVDMDALVAQMANLSTDGADEAGLDGIALTNTQSSQTNQNATNQQQQVPQNLTPAGRRPSQGMFGGFSRSIVVAVDRRD